MLTNETIYNVWEFVILLMLLINTYLLIKNRKKMQKIDKIFNRIKSLTD